MDLKISDRITRLTGVGPALDELLGQLGVKTINDLLLYLPSRLEDRSQIRQINQLQPGEEVVIKATVKNVSSRRSQKGILIIQAKLLDETGQIPALWFNQRYLLSFLRPDQTYYFYGQKRLSKPLGHPFFVKKIIEKPEIMPIYPTTAGLHQAVFRKLLANCQSLLPTLPDLLPAEIKADQQFDEFSQYVRRAHFPQSITDLAAAKKRLGFEELLLLALAVGVQKKERQAQKTAGLMIDQALLKKYVAGLPFNLTAGQRQTAWAIVKDLSSGLPMRRLLYGEVGSGKTAVASIAAVSVLANRQRVIFLVPTTTLAAQQAERLTQFFGPHGFSVALLTGSHKDGFETADCVVATHAAFHKTEELTNVGLIIMDEQHRFGVDQRQTLLSNAADRHVLMMTATPIPRSFAQTIFGYLDITYLLDKPAHQQKITTRRFTAAERPQIETEIEQRLKENQPGYVICPLIEQGSDELVDLLKLERKTVAGEAKHLKERFPAAAIGVVHGRLKEVDKQKVIDDFQNGKIDILVSTTVVEVGIDNQKATWILIEEADRFGLSQLHQLRGRVGRGQTASVCFLADSGTAPIGQQRLEALEKTDDGLALAEEDLRLRGPGELTGLDQSGLPPLKYADWTDTELIRRIFAIADNLLEDGIKNYPLLARRLKKYGGQNQTII